MILCIGTTPATQRVMVFGKLTLDAVNRAATTVDGVAGKSINVAKVLHALGEEPLATGFLGGERGAQIRTLFEERGIGHEFVAVSAPTRQCITVIDQATGAHTELVEEGQPAPLPAYEQLLAIVRRRAPHARALVMSGTIPAGGPVDLYATCIQLAREAKAISIVDAQKAPLLAALNARPTVVKPNRAELAAALGRELPDESAVLVAMRDLATRGAERVIITAGQAPTLAFDGQRTWRIVPPRVKPVNPIGSGDAFTAGLVAHLVRGDDLGEACRWACAAGSANALTLMAGEVEKSQVETLARGVQVESIV